MAVGWPVLQCRAQPVEGKLVSRDAFSSLAGNAAASLARLRRSLKLWHLILYGEQSIYGFDGGYGFWSHSFVRGRETAICAAEWSGDAGGSFDIGLHAGAELLSSGVFIALMGVNVAAPGS